MDDSDVEIEIKDIDQLTTALESDCESACDTTSYDCINSTSAFTGSWLNISKIETAIAFNKLTDEKLKRLETLLQQRLIECREKLKSLPTNTNDKVTKYNLFKYSNCASPYFKDKDLFTPQDNNDTLIMKKSKLYNLNNVVIRGWTVKDKRELTYVIKTMSIAMKRKQILDAIKKLQTNDIDSKDYNKKLAELHKTLDSIENFKDLVLPIGEDYEWDDIAEKLQYKHNAQEYKALWNLFLHPSINKNSWTKKEHLTLQDVALNNNLQNWDKIAKELNTGRTGYQCFVYYRTNMSQGQRKWTQEEDEYLKRLVEFYRKDNYIPWGKIAAQIENRTKTQIYTRWYNSCLPTLKKGRFLPEEDAVLLTCVKKFGPNFAKISRYIAGRSTSQLRIRYGLLQSRISCVWTVEEDKKLVQLIANQNDTTSYSNITPYFPGKTRNNIRMRYSVLSKWMKANPNEDLAFAPRKGARRLVHGSASDTLDAAIEKLNVELQNRIKDKKSKKLSPGSQDDALDNAIITVLVNEHLQEEQNKRTLENIVIEDQVIPENKLQSTNLIKTLISLKANLDKEKFKSSNYSKQYSELLENSEVSLVSKIRSYSRKDKLKQTTSNKNIFNVWGTVLEGDEYVLPPHYATLTGCRLLLMAAADMDIHTNKSIATMCRKNKYFKQEWDLLLHRFKILFTWPLMLSNMGPSRSLQPSRETESFRYNVGYIQNNDDTFKIKDVTAENEKMMRSKNEVENKSLEEIDLTENSKENNLLKVVKDMTGSIVGIETNNEMMDIDIDDSS